MKIIEVVATAEQFFKDVLQKPGVVVGVSREDDSWKVQIEVAEEVEYMRKRARDDLLALYEVFIDDNLEITAFERKSMRERNSTSINTD
ncbi:MAG: gas vesicle protein GvpO [Desulfotomaculaceae bacterium]